jgi:Alpha-L-arabinofuranosidase B (ABFB) domain
MARISFRSTNFPDRFVRHQNFLGELTPIVSDLDKNDGTFNVVPGLADNGCVSFESVNFPNHFLRHQDFRIKLQERPAQVDQLFNADTTFRVREGLSDATACSFVSFNFPDRFMRHRDFHLFLEPADLPPDATFKIELGFIPPAGDDLATFDAGPLTVSGPLPLSGSAHLVMKKNGDFTFNSHAHDAGFDNIDFLISAVLLTPSGIAFTFQHSGHLEGTSGALLGTPNRNDDFVTGGNNVAITNEWSGISVAKLVARIDGGDDLGRGVAAFLGDVLNAAAQELGKELGQAAAKAVIALVAA